MAHEPTQQINVDLGGLQTFNAMLGNETEQGLRPGLSSSWLQMQLGARFGMSTPSGDVHAARIMLQHALDQQKANGDRMLLAAQELTLAIEGVLTNYRDTDGNATVSADIVYNELLQATQDLTPSDPTDTDQVGNGHGRPGGML